MFDVIGQTVKAFSQMRLGPWQNMGDILLVGEGNLSFAKSLLRHPSAHVTHMTATVFEKEKKVSERSERFSLIYFRCIKRSISC